jgi:H+/gluconate symporter-like permease
MFDKFPHNPEKFMHHGDSFMTIGEVGFRAAVVTNEVKPVPPLQKWYSRLRLPDFGWDIAAAIVVAVACKIGHVLYKNPVHMRHLKQKIEEEEDEEIEDLEAEKKELESQLDSELSKIRPTVPEKLVQHDTPTTLIKRVEGRLVDMAEDELRRILDTPIGKK